MQASCNLNGGLKLLESQQQYSAYWDDSSQGAVPPVTIEMFATGMNILSSKNYS